MTRSLLKLCTTPYERPMRPRETAEREYLNSFNRIPLVMRVNQDIGIEEIPTGSIALAGHTDHPGSMFAAPCRG